MRKFFYRSLQTVLAIYIAISGYIYLNQRGLIYFPEQEQSDLYNYNLANTEEIFLKSADGTRIQAWYRKPTLSNKMAILYHGNSGSLEKRLDKLKVLINMGYGFIIPAWRGFDKSEGMPSEAGFYLDARATIEFIEKEGFKTEDIVLIGESLGTGIATKMATEHKFKGLCLITPYTSIKGRAQELYPYLPVGLLLKDNFDNISNIDKVNTPVFIIHGDRDDIIPHHHSIKIEARAKEPKKLIIYPGVNHSNYDVVDVFTEMEEFFSEARKSNGK